MARIAKKNLKKKEPSNQVFLTTEQLAQIGGISRATILRMEEAQLLIPVKRGGRGGARLYGVDAIDKLAKINTFKKLGFTTEQIAGFYNGPEDYARLLEVMQQKLTFLNSVISSLRLQYSAENHDELKQINTLPITAYCTEHELEPDKHDFCENMVQTIREVVEHGYKAQFDFDPVIAICADLTTYVCCVPVSEANEGKPGVVRFSGYHTVCESKMRKPQEIMTEIEVLRSKAAEAGYRPKGKYFISFYTAPSDAAQETMTQLLRFGCEVEQ